MLPAYRASARHPSPGPGVGAPVDLQVGVVLQQRGVAVVVVPDVPSRSQYSSLRGSSRGVDLALRAAGELERMWGSVSGDRRAGPREGAPPKIPELDVLAVQQGVRAVVCPE